jgi:large subunit ribosomal protein L19e
MGLKNKKQLAAKVLKIGKERVYFNPESLKQIEEAITRQDILDLKESGAIVVKEIKGRKKIVRRKHKRGKGKVKKKVNKTKKDYVVLTRKLRKHAKSLKKRGQIDSEQYSGIRKKIRASKFKSKRHLSESEVQI